MTYLNRRTIRDDRLKGLTRRCPECGNTMTATGELYKDEGVSTWFVAFWCPVDQEEFPVWAPELSQFIDRDVQEHAAPTPKPPM